MYNTNKFNTVPQATKLRGANGELIGSLGGAINVHDADVHNILINKYIHQHTATITTLAVATVGGGSEYMIDVASTAGFAVGDFIDINTTTIETTHPKILGIAGTIFTLDRRIDRAHAIGDIVTKVIIDISSQIGSLASPQVYYIGPPPGEVWHMQRLLFSMVHPTAADLGTFGNIASPGLTNGIIVRARISNNYGTMTNWKITADIKTDMFDVEFDSRSTGGGSYGTSGRGTFTEAGIVLRLDGDEEDRVELLVQDDITALDSFTMKVQGHRELD